MDRPSIDHRKGEGLAMACRWDVSGVRVLCGLVAALAAAGCDPEVGVGGPGEAIEVPLVVSFDPLAVEPGDFDGDGAIDLLVSGLGAGVVQGAVLRGLGDGTFAAPVDAHFVACSAYPVVGRMSDDARDDVAALGCPNTMDVLAGQDDATLAPWAPWPRPTLGIVRSSAIVDFEGDGDGDLVTLRRRTNPPSNFLRPEVEIDVTSGAGGDGIWGVRTTVVGNSTWSGFDPAVLATADFDGDALVDVAMTERDGDVVRMLGTIETTFVLPLELGVEVAPWSTRVADLDGDGLDDVVVSSYLGEELQVQLSAGTAGFTGLASVGLDDFAPYDTALGDVDGDGVPDAAFVDDGQAALRWQPGDGAGGWGPPLVRTLASAAIRVHATDLDGNGRDDLVAATFAAGSISILLAPP
jgi:hypothetical protein